MLLLLSSLLVAACSQSATPPSKQNPQLPVVLISIDGLRPDNVIQAVYFSGLDSEQHAYGPYSSQAFAGLERIDEMNSAFLIAGPGILAGRNLGQIDMRDVAPTLAALLGVKLQGAEGRDLLK